MSHLARLKATKATRKMQTAKKKHRKNPLTTRCLPVTRLELRALEQWTNDKRDSLAINIHGEEMSRRAP